MGLGISPLKIKILFESSPPKSRILARRLAVMGGGAPPVVLREDIHALRRIHVLCVYIYIYMYTHTHT